MKRSSPLKRRTRKMSAFYCEGCRKAFQRRADWKPRAASGEVLCASCSRSARAERARGSTHEHRRTGRTVSCTVCGAEFYRKRSELDSGKVLGPVCSRECRSALLRGRPRPALEGRPVNAGEANGRYKHGRSVGRNAGAAGKRATRAIVRERDGDWCLICGTPPPGLHLHRVVYGSHGGRYEPSNCVQLCRRDHALVHQSKRAIAPLLLAYLATPDESNAAAIRAELLAPSR